MLETRALSFRKKLGCARADENACSPVSASSKSRYSNYATSASERLLRHCIRAGVPKAFEPVGMSRFTNEFAPMITLSPMVRPIWITALGPI